jgi:outer membrane receptor protein involved in Fe transport
MRTRSRDFTLLGSRSLIAAAVATALAGPAMVWAQSSDATLRGSAPANAEITATNIATGSTRRTRASAEGSYVLLGLPPGTYRINAGPGTETVVTVSVATTSTLDLGATAGTEEAPAELGQVDVSATRLAEMKTSEIGSYVSQHQIETVPQITRNFLEFADNVPGMAFNVDQNGNTTLRGGAMTTSSTNVFIDGVGQKNYVKEGGVTGQSDSQGNPFPQLAIGEYKVITSNYKAQYDQVSSAAITAETRSGTNEFESAAFYTFTDDGLRERTPSESAAGEKTKSESNEYGISFGGPIIKDKLHYFFTYEAKRFDTPIVVVPGVTDVNSFLPPDVASQFGNSTVSFEEDLFFAKLDWELGINDRIELSGRVRDESKIGNFGNEIAESAGLDTRNDDTRVVARWQHSADNWFNDLVLTYEDAFFNPTSQDSGNGFAYTWRPINDRTIIKVGPADPRATQNKGQKGQGIQNDFTFTGIAGHTFQAGIKYKEAELTAQDAGTGNPQFTFDVDPDDGLAPTPYKVFFTLPVAGLSPVAVSENRQFGIYLQDDWEVNDRLTLNLGVRWDYEETPSYLDYVTPANVIAAFNSEHGRGAPVGQTYGESLALGGVDPNDYVSTGSNRDADTDNFQPRLGFSFDLTGDEQHVLFGGAGRSYDRNLFQWIQLEVTKGTLQNFDIRFNTADHPCPPGPTCVAWDPAYLEGVENLAALVSASNLNGEVFMINNDLEVPYSDQFSIGIRNRLGDWNTSATVARILSKDGFVYTLGNRYPDGSFWTDRSQPWGHSPPGFGAFIIGNNGIETRSTQLLLSAEKPFTEASGWSTTIAYTYNDAEGNRDINETFAFDGEFISDYPFLVSNAVPEHRLVATGSYEGPWGLLFAGKLTLATPIPVNDLGCIQQPPAPTPPVSFPSGAGCMPVSGEPQDTLGFRSVDLQVTKNFNIAELAAVYLRVDVLNVFDHENFNDTVRGFGLDTNGNIINADPVRYNQTGNIRGVPRTIRLTFGAQF